MAERERERERERQRETEREREQKENLPLFLRPTHSVKGDTADRKTIGVSSNGFPRKMFFF